MTEQVRELSAAEAHDLAGELAEQHRRRVVAAAVAAEGTRRATALADDARQRSAGVTRWGWRKAVRFAVEHHMVTPQYLQLYARYLAQRLRHPHVELAGMVFLGRGAQLYARRHHARLALGPWCWVGAEAKLRAHEGNVRLAAKVVVGTANVINSYLDVEIGTNTLLGDWVYICDFDHRHDRVDVPIRKQGIIKSPVRIGCDVWVGEKATILRGADIGAGSVIGSHSLVKGAIEPFSIAVGTPARVIRSRLPRGMTAEEALALQRGGQPLPGDPLDG